MKLFSTRLNYFYGLVAVLALLGTSMYLQYHDGINPCPLCVLQRIAMGLLGVIFFFGIALTLKRVGKIFIGLLSLSMSAIGIALAGRQVWLQHFPQGSGTDCGASIQYMLKVLPFDQVLAQIFSGSAECSRVDWQFLHMSMAVWALICFIGFAIFSLMQLKKK